MIIDFNLSVFRFNAKNEYLPYYKKYNISIEDNLTLKDLLTCISKEDIFFEFPSQENACIFLNSHALEITTKLKDISEYFGNELRLEPLSKHRATKDLIINTDDFKNALIPLQNIIKDNLSKDYEKLIKYFYASPALEYDKEYLGTSMFLLADDLIKEYPEQEEQILELIANQEHGIWYHSPLCHKIYPKNSKLEDTIISLKQKIISQIPHANKKSELEYKNSKAI